MNDYETKRLPNKLNLEMVAAELKLLHLSHSSQLEVILQFQRDEGLILRSDAHIELWALQNCYTVFEREEDDETLTFPADPKQVNRMTNEGEPVTLGAAYLTADDTLSVETFSLDGNTFYPVDNEEDYLIPAAWISQSVYVLKEDLFNFHKNRDDDIPSYADPLSEHYAPELALAIKLHNELRVTTGGNPGQSMKDRVYLWLKKSKSHKDPSDARVNRLATVVGNGKKIP